MIPLVAPTITTHDIDNMMRAIVQKGMLENETAVRHFEEEFAQYVGCAGAVAVNSGTNALVVALKALSLGANDYISVPTFSCTAIANAAKTVTGQHPELVDVEPNVFEARFDPVEGVTINAHMFGTLNNTFGEIDDITLSLGAKIEVPPDIICCSTNADKMISTGRGGIIASNEQGLLEKCRDLAYYDSNENGRGYSFGMTAMQATLGRSQLTQLPSFIERRQETAALYTQEFRQAGIDCPDADCGSVFFRYIISVPDAEDVVRRLAKHGIEAGRGVNPPLHRQLGQPNEDYPGAEWCLQHLVSIPVHPSLTDTNVEHIIESVLKECAP